MWHLKKKELIYKTEVESQVQKKKIMVTNWERSVGGMNWETGTDIYTLLYIKQITSKDLLYNTGSSAQHSDVLYWKGI